MNVVRIENQYRKSNTYIIDSGNKEVTIIDFGGPSIEALRKWLTKHNKQIGSIFLTHEHADHCVGLLSLKNDEYSSLNCTLVCAENLSNKRRNFSLYTDEIETFEISLDFNQLIDDQIILTSGLELRVLYTPGHSPGSICLQVNKEHIFTGDTILNCTKTFLTLPSSNKFEYKESIQRISKIFNSDMMIYPGHGEVFQFKTMEDLYF